MSVPSPSFLPWQFAIDTGGTFTDCLATSPYGERRRIKVLSSGVLRGTLVHHLGGAQYQILVRWPVHVDVFAGYTCYRPEAPEAKREVVALDPTVQVITLDAPFEKFTPGQAFELSGEEEAPVLAMRMITGTPLQVALPPLQLRLGSTKGTNALLERKGAPLTLLVTEGFADILRIGLQQRPDLFSLFIDQPEPLYTQVLEVPERLDSMGGVLHPLKEEAIQNLINQLKAKSVSNVALCLLHSYKNQEHEAALGQALNRAGIRHISISSGLSQAIQYVSRTQTTAVNGYLKPVLHSYLQGIRQALGGQPLHIMTSAGGLVGFNHFHPKDSLFSGPAGGLTGAAAIAQSKGRERVLTFDMGGTSTDVARYLRGFDYQYVTTVGQAQIQSPSLAIETVAAGGGSVCGYDGYRLTVGPDSAGASPGPAAYGAGGPLTVTDVNVLLGKLDPSAFGIPIRPQAALDAVKALQASMQPSPSLLTLLEGLEHLANQKMADAIRKISVERGFHPKEYSLVAFGGAGGQHACALARMLDVPEVIIPYDAGLLSAYGIGETALERFAESQVLQPWEDFVLEVPRVLSKLRKEAQEALETEGVTPENIEIAEVNLFMRLQGQDTPLEVPYGEDSDPAQAFRAQYEALYGHWVDRPLEVASVRLRAVERRTAATVPPKRTQSYRPAPSHELTPLLPDGPSHPVYVWDDLRPGAILMGPCLLVSATQTVFVEPHWQLLLDGQLDAQLTPLRDHDAGIRNLLEQPEAVSLALFTSRFTAIAQEMGSLLQRTSFSVNVKERLDFSCAVLDAEGRLLVNAPHIPVHLGSH
ncbi:MAG TPA: 5-oxoprolinase, partial [Cytophagales bacterium]|nr:5-oxoprolinase [Cytophagales bacterium]